MKHIVYRSINRSIYRSVAVTLLLLAATFVTAEGDQEAPASTAAAPVITFAPYSGGDGLSADEIMSKADNSLIAGDIVADITMTLTNRSGSQRVREMSIVSRDDGDAGNKSVIHFTSPSDVAGTGFLMVENADGSSDMWLYLPELNKVRRIVSENKNESFMGSDISYSDMENRSRDDYNFTRYENDSVNGEQCYVIEAVPATQVVRDDTGYSRLIYWISEDKLIPLKALFFNSDGDLFKQMEMKDFREIDGSWIPTDLVVENIEDQHRTVMTLSNIELNVRPDDSYFTQQYLQRAK